MKPYWRVRWAAIGAAAALVLVGLGWMLTTVIQSPQDALASAAPPPPSQIVVPVERKVLDLEVTVPGRLTSPRKVTGVLSVDDRDRAEKAERVAVIAGALEAEATIENVAADGTFTATLTKQMHSKQEVRVRFVPGQQSESLVVPMSALFTTPAGKTSVVVVEGGVERHVHVTMGEDAAGFVEVVPEADDDLEAGDEVLVSEPTS